MNVLRGTQGVPRPREISGTTWALRTLAVVFDLVVLGLSTLVYARMPGSPLADYPQQMVLIGAMAAVGSILLPFSSETGRLRVLLAGFRALMLAVTVLTIPVVDLRCFPLTVSFTLLLALHTSPRLFLAFQAVWIAIVGLCFWLFANIAAQRPAWTLDFQLFLVCTVSVVTWAFVSRQFVEELRRYRRQNQQLQEGIGRLSSANIGFQQYASLLERESTQTERLRLSREIHDSAGYSLTTLTMLFEAAKGLIAKDPGRLDGLMDEGARISRQALNEIRYVLHELRGRTETGPQGMGFIKMLARNFEAVCGIQIRLEFTNTRGSYGHRIDSILQRMVQEGLTNAFRHGQATQVSIILAEVEGELSVRIRDNGVIPAVIQKGIGLSGMEERVASVGGKFQYLTEGRGFEILALLPIQEEG